MPLLLSMADDPAAEVRQIVAARLPVGLVGRLARDEDLRVRWEVGQRAGRDLLRTMQDDADSAVRALVAQRLGTSGGEHG